MIWLQYALLGTALFALVKGVIVFCGTVILSWLTILCASSAFPLACGWIAAPSQVAVTQKVPAPKATRFYARLRQFVSL